MKINPVSLNCTNYSNFKNTKKTIAFLGSISKDSFESVNSGQVTKLRGELSAEEIKDILDKMTPENLISKTGQREVYKINGKIVKTTATPESKNFVTAENFALEKLFEDNITTTAKPLGLFDIKGDNQFYEGVRYIQIQEPIDAKSIGTNPENYSTEMFKKYLSALFDLDEKGFINHNLTPENIGITPNGDIKIFNFGNFSLPLPFAHDMIHTSAGVFLIFLILAARRLSILFVLLILIFRTIPDRTFQLFLNAV